MLLSRFIEKMERQKPKSTQGEFQLVEKSNIDVGFKQQVTCDVESDKDYETQDEVTIFFLFHPAPPFLFNTAIFYSRNLKRPKIETMAPVLRILIHL